MPKTKDSSVQVAVIVAGLLAVVGGAWVFLNSGTEEAIEATQVASVPTTVAAKPMEAAPEKVQVDAALQMAEMAFQSGQLAGEEEGTAVDFYRQVLEQDPNNRRALAGMQLIATQLIDEAEDLMIKGSYDQVVDRIKSLNKIEAGSDAVLALQKQLVEKAESMFAEMDTAIEEGRLERAEVVARSLRLIPDADSGRINAAMVTIAQTRKEREAAANEARALAQRSVEPDDIPTTETVANVSSNRIEDDTDFISDTVSNTDVSLQTDVSTDSVVQTTPVEPVEMIDPAQIVREQIESLLADASARVEQNRLIAPEGDNALEFYNQVLALETTNVDAKRGLRGIVQKLTSKAYDLADAGNIDGAKDVLDDAESVGIAMPLVTQAREDVREAWLKLESEKVFSLSQFTVKESVPPKYPSRAMTRSIEGWVKVEFTVAEDGKTRDLKVVESSKRLAKQFSNAAIRAVEQWQFEPRVLDGEVIAQRSETTVQFKLTE